jgi:hypothetical protein
MQVKNEKKYYEFQKYVDEQKHLDTDETRHLMKPIVHVIVQDFKGEEHKYCDKEQRNAEGKFRRPKKLIESEQRGFKSVSDMVEADKKAEEDNKKKEMSDLRQFTQKQNDVIQKLIEKQDTLENTIKQQNELLQQMVERLKK